VTRRLLILNERDPRNPLSGGCEVYLFEIFSRLAARGHHVTLLAATFPGCSREETIDGVHVRRLTNRYAFYFKGPLEARRLARAGSVDVVIDALSKLPFLSPWLVPAPCLALVMHLFGTTAFAQAPFPVALVTWLSEKLIPACYRSTPMVSISPSTRDDLVERGLPYEMVAIVPCGIDHGLYRPVAGSSSASPLIGWLGRVEKYKRLDNMLEAMVGLRKQIPDLRLVVIGDGGALQESRQLATHLGLDDCVEFAGFVSAERKVELLGQAHVLVNSSEKEGWGLTVIEGNACGTPTVASNVPGLRDSVVDGETGLLYEYADVAAMESALLKVLSDAQLRQRLETAALEWAARFTWDAAACDVETLVERSLHGGGDPGSLELQSPTF